MIRRPPRSTLFPYPTLFRSSVRSSASLSLAAGRAPRATRCSGHTATATKRSPGLVETVDCCPSPRNSTPGTSRRSEEHTSELQSQSNLVCRLLLEKKKLAVPDDYYVVSARQPGYAPWSTYIINFPGSTAWANGTLWPIVSRISGYLTDAAYGSPVPGLTVSAIDLRTSYQAMTTADASGFFSVAVPPSPAMSVWVYGNANYAGNVSYVETRPYLTTWVNMTIDRLSATIVANVTNAVTGQPIAGVSVIAAWFTGNSFGTTNATGIAIVNAPTGIDVYVTAIASGYEYWTGILQPVAGTNPLSISLWPILPYDVHIRGDVRDPNSRTRVSYVAVEAASDTCSTATAYTNGTGYYDLSTVAAPQTVQARETGFAGSQASVSPASGDVLWVNLTLAADSRPPVVRTFTPTPSTGL